MEASAQQLRETLRLTEQCLQIRSTDDLQQAIDWFSHIIDFEQALALQINPQHLKPVQTHVSFNKFQPGYRCQQSDFASHPILQNTLQSLQGKQDLSFQCVAPCGGKGLVLAQRAAQDAEISILMLTAPQEMDFSVHRQLLSFVLPHFDHAMRRCVPVAELQLSEREKEVLQWVARGKSNWEVAQILTLSENTIKFHMGNICKKMGVQKRAHAIAMAAQANLLTA